MQWLLEEATSQAVLVVFEDLHWADPSTLELLSLLFDQVPTARIMVLLTFRPEFTLPWMSRAHFTQLMLGGLGHRQVAAVVECVAGGRPLPDEVTKEVIAKTDGVPLFVEELTKMVLESGLLKEGPEGYQLTGRLTALDIPVTLQDSLMARLDRLGEAKEVAQLGATLGREFNYELIRAVARLDETNLRQGLRQLVESGLIYQRGLPPHASYAFKHVLIQRAAYEALLRRRRQTYHKQAARVLREQFPDVSEAQPELLAYHCTEGGLNSEAVVFWARAGEKAMRRSALAEAVSHLTKGLELVRSLPDPAQRVRQELRLRSILGPVLIAVKGYGAAEVERSYARARQLCQETGETPELAPVLMGLEAFYLLRGELGTARDLASQLLALAKGRDESDIPMLGHSGMGVVRFYFGDFAAALDHLNRGIALYEPGRHRNLAFQDPGVACLSWVAVAQWIQGSPEHALELSREAVNLAESLSHPFSLAFALIWAARIHHLRREPEGVRWRAEQAVAMSIEQGFPYLVAQGTLMGGWALAQQGDVEQGLAEMHRGFEAWQATGAKLGATYILALRAEAYTGAGQPEKGLEALHKALAWVERTGERWWETELRRLEGQLYLGQGGGENHAERCFRRALALAERQQARSLQLRAAMSLVRLGRQTGSQNREGEVLRRIYGGFEEGRDTPDLVDAGAVLEQIDLRTRAESEGGSEPDRKRI